MWARKIIGCLALLLICLFCCNISTFLKWQSFSKIPLNQTYLVQGSINSLILKPQNEFIFKISAIQNKTFNKKFYFKPSILVKGLKISPPVKPGQIWQLSLRFKPLHNYKNLGSQKLTWNQMVKGVFAVAYLSANENAVLLRKNTNNFDLLNIRQNIYENILKQNIRNPGLILALIIGDKSAVPAKTLKLFQNCGLSHLIAISGLHIGLIAGLAYFLFYHLLKTNIGLTKSFALKKITLLLALMAAFFYSALAGFSVSVLRALIMYCCFSLGLLFNRYSHVFRILFFACLLILIWNPLFLTQAGLSLSGGAVAGIFYFTRARFKALKGWQSLLVLQFFLTLWMSLLSLFWFGFYSSLGILANCVAIPLMSFFIIPCALLSLLPLIGHVFLILADKALSCLLIFLNMLSQLPGQSFSVASTLIGPLFFAQIGLLLLCAPKGLPGKTLALFWILPLFLYQPIKLTQGQFQLTVLDVGQGLAVLVLTQHHRILYDAGPKYPSGFDAGDFIVKPFLKALNIKNLDAMIISHPDSDHFGGAPTILQNFSVPLVYSSSALPKIKPSFCQETRSWQWDGVNFHLFNVQNAAFSRNNQSCLLRVERAGTSILLTGDIEKKAEKSLLLQNKLQKNQILIAPHHGSRSSSSKAFIEKIAPSYVIFATGFQNRYHFPSAKIVKSYKNQGTSCLNTAKSGQISFTILQNGVIIGPQYYQKKFL